MSIEALREGDPAPAIHSVTDTGDKFDLRDLRGQPVVVYFYPKADTPGCTAESCEFRDNTAAYSDLDAVVVGISPDKPDAQAKFKYKFGLPFTLLADEDHHVCEEYGVWVEKSMYGRKYMGVERTTFVIDKHGAIRKIFEKVKPVGHAAEVLEALRAL